MEGLRAPSVGPSLAKATNAGRAAAAIAAAAAAGAIGVADPVGKLPAVSGQLQQALPQVSRAAPLSAADAPTLLGNLAQKAPSLGRGGGSLSGASGALNSAAASSVAPTVERGIGGGALSGAAAAAAAAGKTLAPLAKGFASPLNPLIAVLPDLLFPASTQKANDEAKAIKDADKALADRDAQRKKQGRKGDTAKSPIPERNFPPLTGTRDVQYRVSFSNADGSPNEGYLYGPIGGSTTVREGDPVRKIVKLNGGRGSQLFLQYTADLEAKDPQITGITPVDGSRDPEPNFTPQQPGDPLTGLDNPIYNQDAPALPGMPGRPTSPATNPNRPAAASEMPANGLRNPSNPSTPNAGEPTKPGGESTPQQPQNPLDPANPSTPGQGMQTGSPSLPGIPSAPTTGSATLTAPTFPSTFTQTPGARNSESFKSLEGPPSEPQRKPGCADPCMASLQNAIPPLGEALDGLEALLSQLLSGQQEQQAEQQEQSALITINVPICNCNDDGTANIENVSIRVLESQVEATQEQFATLANVQSLQCKMQRHTERAYNILGGDVWFKTPDSRESEYKTKLERKVKEIGPLFGFPAIPDEDPVAVAIEEEQARLTGQPIPGQIKVKSMIGLLNAYTSNLYHRAGFQGLPTSVPQTLLGYTDTEDPKTIKDLSSYFVWFVQQVDALIGKFPINITIEDVDPLTEGNQTKEVELPNISEALAEMYGLNISSSVNADVTVNFLMRLASELIATKNSTLITQDYARANAAFLGYKGNPARREINYSFNPAKLDSLDEFLKESKGYLVGWEEDDKESVVGFLQRIVFSSGIIKAAFFRDKKRLLELQKEIESMMTGDKVNADAEWDALLALINNPEEYFNKDSIPHPRVRNKPAPEPPETTA